MGDGGIPRWVMEDSRVGDRSAPGGVMEGPGWVIEGYQDRRSRSTRMGDGGILDG